VRGHALFALQGPCELIRKECGHALLKLGMETFLTLNLHVNIVNVNAEKTMYSVFIMHSPPTISSAPSNAAINCRIIRNICGE